mmetsp:Transcript_15857/g.21471  ORF Transcript_15857/g.21471 Transcript_15857/m.21471 type:complete len:102 (-) Transcript_15857:569-874(-)|eukprot:CAMPEP_0185596644 /NCGR_PEP_ID=MMETSP0434-20130131/80874_1 /TAXON_ID=626734 ORGANISM="Favella taraikaensis, Strain Fe Narragansett Bay" /NCGR_SAMPLE_ID=MMETSP0434 /ASSEMBLY_ACC=CAM_ASM_000379 /LENGTH=101 /DNA_ID=CAMNT_0028225175 /DNA_START=127 /DNA_END=432 /DNA_ORIENTATION=-
MVLQKNNLNDACFAAILKGLQRHSHLRHIHYGYNEFGSHSNKMLAKLLQVPFPNQVKSLVLTNIRTNGKVPKPEDEEEEQLAVVNADASAQFDSLNDSDGF